ncbi:MAG: peptidoglycan-binding domain-containing protein, partial [Candidatus Paceibacterota bacterium]
VTNSCLKWGATTNCPTGQTCSGAGVCAAPACIVKTCATLGNYECGNWDDSCGDLINCGACASGKLCNAAGRCVSSGGGGAINPSVNPIAKMTRAEIIAKINEIMALIAKLQAQLKAMTGQTAYSCAQLTKVLRYGMQNDAEVKCLQEVLRAQGYTVAVSGNYDLATKNAVAKFQQKYATEILIPYGLRSGSGNVGNATKNKLNQLIDGR